MSRIPTALALRIVGVAATVYALVVFMLAVQLSVAIGGALTWGIPITVAVLMVALLWYRQTIAATGVPVRMIWQLPDQQEVVLRLPPSEALAEVRQTAPNVTVDRLTVTDVNGGMSITAPRRTWRGAVTVTVRTIAAADGCTRVTLRAAPGRFIDHGFACAVAYMIADWLRASRSYVADAEPAEVLPRLGLGDRGRPESGDAASGIIGD